MLLAIVHLVMLAASLMGLVESGSTGGLFQAAPEFDFAGLALVMAGLSFSVCGVLMVGSWLLPDIAEKAKRTWLPNTIMGLIVMGIGALIVTALTP